MIAKFASGLRKLTNKILWRAGWGLISVDEHPIMIHVFTTVQMLGRRFPNGVTCVETGTIRSVEERHFGTYHMARAAGSNGTVLSVDRERRAIEVSKRVCLGLRNIQWFEQDSLSFIDGLEDNSVHFALLDSVNDPAHIFAEYQRILPKMHPRGVIIVDDAGIAIGGELVDDSVAAKKGHDVWKHLTAEGKEFEVLMTPFGHGTQLRIQL
jgi:hypothetical protein